jgi:hypothetical protein
MMRNYIKNFNRQDLIDLIVSAVLIGIAFQILFIVQGL